jgi:mono/diheme cytochrome c family protein
VAGAICLTAPARGSAQWLDLPIPGKPEQAAAAVDEGRDIYLNRCWFCHGEEGDGEGPVAEYLWPRPRDFTAGSYRLRTTESGELPTDEDLFRTISLGIPGTAMPAWSSALSAEQRWKVAWYIKGFAEDLFEDDAFDPYQFIVEIGAPPPDHVDSLIERGRRLFGEADCWECHGQSGRGDGEKGPELLDDWDYPIWPANLRMGWKFKGGTSIRELYLRLSSGLDGTPMPSYSETLSDEERWEIAYYLSSLLDGGGGPAGAVITAGRLEGDLPQQPDDQAWERASEVSIPLTGQATFAPRWQIPAVTDLQVRVLYNEEQVALRLAWDDRSPDTNPADSARAGAEGWKADDTYPRIYPGGERARGMYPDAAEVMYPARAEDSPVLPHLVYGSGGDPVNLWRWRADLPPGGGVAESVGELRAAGAQRPPEELEAESRLAEGSGRWHEGRWTVVIRRPLSASAGSAPGYFRPGQSVPIAFHVWDGGNGETGLRMALSSWYFLHLREPAPASSYLGVLVIVLGTAALEYGLVRWMKGRADRGYLTTYGIEGRPAEKAAQSDNDR